MPDTWVGNGSEFQWPAMPLRRAANIRNSNVDKVTHVSETPVRLCNYVDVYRN